VYLRQVDPQTFEDTSSNAVLLVNQTEQQVFRPNSVMIQVASAVPAQLDDHFGTGSQADLTENDMITTTYKRFYGAASFMQVNTEVCEYFGCNTFPL